MKLGGAVYPKSLDSSGLRCCLHVRSLTLKYRIRPSTTCTGPIVLPAHIDSGRYPAPMRLSFAPGSDVAHSNGLLLHQSAHVSVSSARRSIHLMRWRDRGMIAREGLNFLRFKETLIDSGVPAAQGSAAVFGRSKRRKTKGSGNRVFRFSSLKNPGMDFSEVP